MRSTAQGSCARTPAPIDQHPISYALERAAIALKGLNWEKTPIAPNDARDILRDATRLVGELIETLHHYEAQSPLKTGVLGALADVFDRLDHEWQALDR